ncbi:MAG: hypothetical protein HYZ49_13245 [Chloroflexi bacterium]|nr:hypothetical protein [Chloroflexota bacterium]
MNTIASESNTTLRPPWVHLARAAWILISLATLTLFLVGTVKTIRAPLPSCIAPDAACTQVFISREDAQIAEQMGLPIPLFAVTLALAIVARLSLVVVGIIIFWRRSDDWVAMMLSGSLMTTLIEGGFGNMGVLNVAIALLFAIGAALFNPLPFVFPNGRPEPRWTRWIVIPLTAGFTLTSLAAYFSPQWAGPNAALTIIWVTLSLYAMVYRYFRVSNAVERQQTKWVLLGLSATFVVGINYVVSNSIFPSSQPSPTRITGLLIGLALYLGGYGFFAFSMGVAMLRYRLWDIDLLIRRTLIYSILSGLLALTYFGSVVVLQGIFTAISGQSSAVSIVISTLTIAALFFPLRNRVQDFIDRRFYRKKYDAAKTLAEFAATCRDETDLDKLTARLVEVVDETMQPESVALWLKPTETAISRKGINDQR